MIAYYGNGGVDPWGDEKESVRADVLLRKLSVVWWHRADTSSRGRGRCATDPKPRPMWSATGEPDAE